MTQFAQTRNKKLTRTRPCSRAIPVALIDEIGYNYSCVLRISMSSAHFLILTQPRNFMKNMFFAILFAALVFIGCNKNQPQQSGTTTTEPNAAAPTLDVPMPTAEILSAVGPENNISIQHLLPNPFFVAFGKPKQFMASPVGIGNEWISSMVLVQSLQLYSIVPGNIEFFVQTIGLPQEVPIVVPHQDPNMPPQQRDFLIARRATVITFSTPVDPSALLASTLEPGEGLDTRKRTEGKTEYYDITPSDAMVPQQRLAIGFIDEHTIVLAEGVEEDIKAIFSDTVPKGAALDRLKHAPIDESEFTMITSLEGLPINPVAWDNLVERIGKTGSIPSNFVPLIHRHLRAMTLSLNVAAVNGQPIVSVYVEGRDVKGAEDIREAIQGLRIALQTTLATMSEDAKKTMPIPADFAMSFLNAVTVEVEGVRVHVALNSFETLIPTVAEGIHGYQISMQQAAQQQRQLHALRVLGGICVRYYDENENFPADIVDAEGKPLLSWRVALLPLAGKLFPDMGLDDLYNKFKLDEPWDSANNIELLDSMPIIFHSSSEDVAPPKTVFRFFDSPGTPFSDRNLKIGNVMNPLSTFMFVIVSPQYAVAWTKPEMLEFNIDTIGDVVGNPLMGVTFAGEMRGKQILPKADPRYEEWKREIEMLIKGTLPQPLEVQE